MFQVYLPNVSSIIRRMLQVFYLDVAKIDLDVAYTCKLQVYVSSVSDVSYECCKCFFRTLYMFCNGYTRVFLVFQTYVSSVSTVLDICCKYSSRCAKVDPVLHML
jgi:hypothetical protein